MDVYELYIVFLYSEYSNYKYNISREATNYFFFYCFFFRASSSETDFDAFVRSVLDFGYLDPVQNTQRKRLGFVSWARDGLGLRNWF